MELRATAFSGTPHTWLRTSVDFTYTPFGQWAHLQPVVTRETLKERWRLQQHKRMEKEKGRSEKREKIEKEKRYAFATILYTNSYVPGALVLAVSRTVPKPPNEEGGGG